MCKHLKCIFLEEKTWMEVSKFKKSEKVKKKILAIFAPQAPPPSGGLIYQLRGGVSKKYLVLLITHP